MGRRRNSWAKKVKPFLVRLKKSDHRQDPPQSKLLDEAGRLCQGLRRSPLHLEKLVLAMAQGRHWGALLANIRVVQACVLVHIRKSQYDTACRLLESCRAMEKEELVQLWNEVHYRQVMEKRHTSSLTAVQKFRCRKRNPPPASLCLEGVKNRNYPEEVRQTLKHFAREVTTKPSRKQRESLARDTNLQPKHIYNWFANYRRRQPPQPSRVEEPIIIFGAEDSASQGTLYITQAAGGFPEDAGLEQMEQTRSLVTRSPGWEQAAGGQGSLGGGAFLALHGSSLQSDPLEGFGTSAESATPSEIKEPAVFYPQTEAKPGMSLSTTTGLETRWEPAGCTPELWKQYPVGCPCSLYSTPQIAAERLPVFAPAPETAHKEVQCSLWSWDASCEENGSMPTGSPTVFEGARMTPGVCVAARPETVSEQADLEIEGLVFRERRLGSLGPRSAMLGTPWCCPVAPVPSPEDSPASAQEQVLWDSVSDPSTLDTLWAAWLLCEFSSSNRT